MPDDASVDVAAASMEVIVSNVETIRRMGLTGDPIDVPENASAMERFLGLTVATRTADQCSSIFADR